MKINPRGNILMTIFLMTLFLACKTEGEKVTDTSADTPQKPATSALGSISPEAMRDLWDNCNAIDVIFYETNFSMSQTDQPAIRNTLGFFLPAPVTHNPNCKPIGRLSCAVNGEIRQEADIYNTQGCQYFIWLKDNKPAYINPMSPQGITFFENIMKQGVNQQQ